jgi:hypothetical protein
MVQPHFLPHFLNKTISVAKRVTMCINLITNNPKAHDLKKIVRLG